MLRIDLALPGRPTQKVETLIAVTVINRMLDLGRPDSVRAT
ncbi:hypothetical protein N825_31925 [Skermanella stibiiresistens SB22]|uniref:Uncharacterized protein n=1 Tax=Skermanella stibiiresistens SB22 TaxID=1385369 RepID=W9GQA5_9PROT|nr:hypothetical protein N825_31925 [Skermanella stibiiresistens SB22]